MTPRPLPPTRQGRTLVAAFAGACAVIVLVTVLQLTVRAWERITLPTVVVAGRMVR